MRSESVIGTILGMIMRTAFVIIAILLIYRCTSLCYDYGYRIFAEPPISKGEGRIISVTIVEDMSPFDMGDMLEAKGLVRDGKLLGLQYYCSEFRKDIKPGTYDLSTAMTAEEMFEVMATEQEEIEVPDDAMYGDGMDDEYYEQDEEYDEDYEYDEYDEDYEYDEDFDNAVG